MDNASINNGRPQQRIGYIVKRYPRYSETFIVNEILSHEAAGLPIEIFSLRPPCDTHFQDVISQVRAPVHYLPRDGIKLKGFWTQLSELVDRHPSLASNLPAMLRLDPYDIVAAMALARHIEDAGISHLHAHFATSPSDVAWLASQLSGIPYTLTAHAKDIFHEDVNEVSLRRCVGDAKAVVTVSDFNVRYLRKRLGPAADRVVRIYNGLNLDAFPFLQYGRRKPRILAVGRLVEKKGFSDLIEACGILRDRGVEFDCHVIGDGPLSGDLQEQCTNLNLNEEVSFLGPQPQATVKAALQEAAVFAAPCVEAKDGNRDGLPTVLLEAMALGTPCVSTPVTGIPEAVLDRETGLIVAQHDVVHLADSMETLLANPSVAGALAASARKLIEEDFDVKKNTARQRELFKTSTPLRSIGATRQSEQTVEM